jgi:lysophospholipase L1-like esterase
MTRTILFFGDSNTRGYGVGRERRYAALIEAELHARGEASWKVAVSGADSDFRVIPARLDAAIAKHQPDILVWQLPTGPAAYFVRYPPWLRPLRALYNSFFAWQRERHIRGDITRMGGPERRPRREAMFEGMYVASLYRWRPASWPITRHANRWLAARYGLVVKATRERYLEIMARHRERLRAQTGARFLFFGLLPQRESFYPGFGARVLAWSKDLGDLLDRPADGSHYLDVSPSLVPVADAVVLEDGAHLTASGHRQVAALVLPRLVELMRAGAVERPGEGSELALTLVSGSTMSTDALQAIDRVSSRERFRIAASQQRGRAMDESADKVAALRDVTRALDGIAAPHALIGGVAVGLRSGVARATMDTDLAVRSSIPRERVVEVLRHAGLMLRGEFTHSVKSQHQSGEPVQLFFDTAFDEIIDRAEALDVGGMRVRVVQTADLIAMKERAAADPARRRGKALRDQADVALLRGDVPDPDEGW